MMGAGRCLLRYTRGRCWAARSSASATAAMHRSLGPKSDRGGRPGLVLVGLGILALVAPAAAGASDSGAVVKLTTVKVGAAGNPSVAVVPFTDAVYRSCADAPQTEAGCQTVGGVGYHYGIGRLEITVGQWVAFLNTADPTGKNRRHLYDPAESSLSWPRYGQIDQSSGASRSRHYSVAYPEWTNKPYGAANFLRAARFRERALQRTRPLRARQQERQRNRRHV